MNNVIKHAIATAFAGGEKQPYRYGCDVLKGVVRRELQREIRHAVGHGREVVEGVVGCELCRGRGHAGTDVRVRGQCCRPRAGDVSCVDVGDDVDCEVIQVSGADAVGVWVGGLGVAGAEGREFFDVVVASACNVNV